MLSAPRFRRVDRSASCEVKYYDGFELRDVPVDAEGAYEIPVFEDAEGTIGIVYATHVGARPRSALVTRERGEGQEVEELRTPDLNLADGAIGRGIVHGHVHTAIGGGRFGGGPSIAVDANLPIEIVSKDGGFRTQLTTDDRGEYSLALPPGEYRIITARNISEEFEIRSGETTWRPVRTGVSIK